MFNLFSTFDLNFFLCSFISVLMIALVMHTPFWTGGSMVQLMTSTSGFFLKFFVTLKLEGITKNFINTCTGTFVFIMLLNFLSVYPFNFASTSQMSMVMILATMFWLSMILASLIFNAKGLLSHFIPEGSPSSLVIFLFLIEVISNFIRPITLSVRLVANIMAGHLLMVLLASCVMNAFYSFPFYVLLNMVELGVAVIQSYIFVTMVFLYYSEL